MPPKKRMTPDEARAIRRALATDLTVRGLPLAYETTVLAVERANGRLKADPDARLDRQEVEMAKVLIRMGGAETLVDTNHEKDIARLSLAELERMISDLKVVDAESVATEDLDIFK
jgi:hypothetical protein